jgi:hypothetical protein
MAAQRHRHPAKLKISIGFPYGYQLLYNSSN